MRWLTGSTPHVLEEDFWTTSQNCEPTCRAGMTSGFPVMGRNPALEDSHRVSSFLRSPEGDFSPTESGGLSFRIANNPGTVAHRFEVLIGSNGFGPVTRSGLKVVKHGGRNVCSTEMRRLWHPLVEQGRCPKFVAYAADQSAHSDWRRFHITQIDRRLRRANWRRSLRLDGSRLPIVWPMRRDCWRRRMRWRLAPDSLGPLIAGEGFGEGTHRILRLTVP